jgi:nucleotide-binding universal stress UspA family protein
LERALRNDTRFKRTGVEKMRFLVAVDGSDTSKNALRQTLIFVKEKGGEVLVHTVPPFYGTELDFGMVGTIEEVFMGPAEAVIAEAREMAKEAGVEIETVIETGIIHQVIIDTAIANDIDIIVMGRRGLTRLERAFVGSVTARVIGHSSIDVLVMPRESILKWDKLLLPVDGSKYSEQAAKRAIQLTKDFGGELAILGVVDMNPELFAIAPDIADQVEMGVKSIVEDAKKLAEKAGVDAAMILVEGAPHERILGVSKDIGAGLICMGSHGRTGIGRLMMGSVTERVIGEATTPVLVVKIS